MAIWRLGTAGMVLATACTMAARVAEAQLAALPLSVAICDYAALPAAGGRAPHIRGEEQEPGRRRSIGRHHGARDWPPVLPPDSHATGIMALKVDLFLIEHGGVALDPRQASMIRARIGSMPRSEQAPCGA